MKTLIILSVLLASSLLSATFEECRDYRAGVAKQIDQFNLVPKERKQYPLILMKSYLDDLVLKCDGIYEFSSIKEQIPSIKQYYKKYVPYNIQKLPENQWKY